MKKFLSAVLTAAAAFVLCSCVYAEDLFTLHEDGSGSLYSYVLVEKDTYDALLEVAGSLAEGDAAGEEPAGDLPVVKVDGIEYYEMENRQEFRSAAELEAFLEDEYEDVHVDGETVSFRVVLDEEDTGGMTYEELRSEYGAMGINLDTAIEGFMKFQMPAAVVSTTGTVAEDGVTAEYRINLESMVDGMDIFVTTSETEAANEKIRQGIENTKITVRSSLTSDGKIKLTWKKSAGYRVDYYEVFRSTKKSSGYGKKAYYKTADGKKTTYTNSRVQSGIRYYYKVRGVRMVDGEKICTPYSNKANRKVK